MWLERIAGFLEARGPALAEVLDAWGCREGWLQAEMYRTFRPQYDGFRVNGFPLDDNCTADISCETGERMIGEVKVLGSGYQTKSLGAPLKPVLEKLGRPISRTDRKICPNPRGWGLIPDFFRLAQARPPRGTERLLVLVADVTDGDTQNLARVLRQIEFTGKRQDVPLPRGFARVWSV